MNYGDVPIFNCVRRGAGQCEILGARHLIGATEQRSGLSARRDEDVAYRHVRRLKLLIDDDELDVQAPRRRAPTIQEELPMLFSWPSMVHM